MAQDPNLEPPPDFDGPAYQTLRNLIIGQADEITPQQAAEQLRLAYNTDRATRVAAWDERIRLQQEAEALQAQQFQDEEDARRAEEERLAEAEKKELEKKKPKINDFDENRTADSVIVPDRHLLRSTS
jgi:hypothetical protein